MPRIRAENIGRHKAQTRAAIMNAAAEAFYAHGFDGVSIGSIADIAGLPRSTVYDYFPNKAAILAAFVAERIPPLVDEWQGQLSTDDPLLRLEGMFEATFRASAAHPGLAALILGAGRSLPVDLRDELVPLVWMVLSELGRICAWGIAEGVFVDGDPEAMASAATDLLAGGVEELLGHGRESRSLQVVMDTRIGLLRRGILA
jgi:AcrR family transcriptional regulator